MAFGAYPQTQYPENSLRYGIIIFPSLERQWLPIRLSMGVNCEDPEDKGKRGRKGAARVWVGLAEEGNLNWFSPDSISGLLRSRHGPQELLHEAEFHLGGMAGPCVSSSVSSEGIWKKPARLSL